MGMLSLYDSIAWDQCPDRRIPFILQYEKGEIWKVAWLLSHEFKHMLYIQYALASGGDALPGVLLDCDSDVALLRAPEKFCIELWYSKSSDLYDQMRFHAGNLLNMPNDLWSVTYDGLLPVIVKDFHSDEILMLAWINREAWIIGMNEGKTCFYSRSRKKLWRKGEQSGHDQIIKECSIFASTDSRRKLPPTLLYSVAQKGCACHEGYYSCFHRRMYPIGITMEGERIMDPEMIYRKGEK